jgi:hypothetical protein
VHLLDSLDDERSKSRFRESIYISIIFYLALAWLIVYGPKYVFHQGRIVPSAAEVKEKNRLTEMELNREAAEIKQPPKIAPKLDRRALEQLQAMRRENEAARAEQARRLPQAPKPQEPPPASTPPPKMAQAQPTPPLPEAPKPQIVTRQPAPSQAIPDAPSSNLPPAPSAGQGADQTARATSPGSRLSQGRSEAGPGGRVGKQAAGTGVEILSDTQGVDFRDYIKRLLRQIRDAWIPLIPEECQPPLNKEGWTLIRFTIMPDGTIKAGEMHLDDSTRDRAIDKAAWGSITSVGQFAPLPKEFKGPNLELRIQFIISRNPPTTD